MVGQKEKLYCIYSFSPLLALPPEFHLLSDQQQHHILIGAWTWLCLNHPDIISPPHHHQSVEKLSSTKPVPGAKNVGDCCFIPCSTLSELFCKSYVFQHKFKGAIKMGPYLSSTSYHTSAYGSRNKFNVSTNWDAQRNFPWLHYMGLLKGDITWNM